VKKLKLKAYDDFEKKGYEVIEISFERNEVIVLFRGGLRNRYRIDDVTIFPFIGLVDKNSNEIYEGDLLKKGCKDFIVTYDDLNTSFIGINKYNSDERAYITNLIKNGFTVS
jgi:uncharacterized phage protein (TIGR01671 family)